MATDATGTPTSLGIPTYNVDVDAPSGLGFNAAQAVIDALIAARVSKPAGLVSGEIPVWNGSAFVRSSVTNVGPTSLGTGTPDATKFLRGDGTWATATTTQEMATASITANVNVTATTEATANTVITLPATAFDGSTKVKIEFFTPRWQTPAASEMVAVLYDGASSIGIVGYGVNAGAGGAGKFEHILTPAAATKTYSIRGYVSSGTGIVIAGLGGLGAAMPAVARIVRA